MEILVTDVTEMSGTNYCVAGWDAASKRMVRPLPAGGHWPHSTIVKFGIKPGTVLKATPAGSATGAFPHRTEDTPIDSTSISTTQSSPDWLGSNSPDVSKTISEAFNDSLKWNKIYGGVHQGVYVPKDTQCSSLGAVLIRKANLSFEEPFGKLLAIVDDGSSKYQLSVSSHIYKAGWKNGGVDSATQLLPNRAILHVRVGLARDFEGQPNRCYLMVNGIL